MNKPVRPAEVGAPSANYELAMVSSCSPGQTVHHLHTSGIGPTTADGSVPDCVDDQADVVWSTLLALLAASDMTPADVVQVTTFVVDPGQGDELTVRLSAAMAARDRALGGHRCASVLVPVPALATPTWKLEVAIVAMSGA